MNNKQILAGLKGGLVVSCQAQKGEPLHSAHIMSRMAVAAWEGGAVGIRANSPEDVAAIQKEVPLPLIALYKKAYDGSPVYITPTMAEVDALMTTEPAILAVDATARPRPSAQPLADFYREIREKYPTQLLMADVSTVEEGLYADELGFDIIGTTLAGYTDYTKERALPDFTLMRSLVKAVHRPIIGEGGIWSPEDLARAIETGIWAAVVGTAITRPREITRRFLSSLR